MAFSFRHDGKKGAQLELGGDGRGSVGIGAGVLPAAVDDDSTLLLFRSLDITQVTCAKSKLADGWGDFILRSALPGIKA